MDHQPIGLAAWPDSVAGDDDRPWQKPSPEDAGNAYDNLLSFAVYHCAHYQPDKQRAVRDTRRRLLSEARSLEVTNAPFALHMAVDLRHVAACLPQRSRGRPAGDNLARAIVNAVVEGLPPALEAAGGANMAATLLDPGQAPKQDFTHLENPPGSVP